MAETADTSAAPRADGPSKAAWLAFATLCLGDLMIVLDSTVVNVALPSIRSNLGFSETGLVWVVNAYILTFGGFLLLGGRMADLYGPKRLFMGGLIAFTLASLICGLAPSQGALILARAVQGVAGAVVSAVVLSLIVVIFPEGPGRVRAMGYFGFVMAGGGSVGVMLGGLITELLDWRWVFLINLPIGAGVWLAASRLLPGDSAPPTRPKLDVLGAALVTAAVMLAVYGVVGAETSGWAATVVWGPILSGTALLVAFVAWERRAAEPLVPLELFSRRNVTVANVVGVLWAAAMFAWFFLAALYLQRVLGFGPLAVGFAFLPANLIMAAFSWSLSAKAVNRFGLKRPAAVGLAIAGTGLAVFALAPADGDLALPTVITAMLLLGIGAGLAFNPVLLAAMNDVEPERSGLASGLVNTAFMLGGALGLAVLAAVAAATTDAAASQGRVERLALHDGYAAAFWAGAVCAALAAVLCLSLRERSGSGQAQAVH